MHAVARTRMLRARRLWVKGRGAADWKYLNCRGADVQGKCLGGISYRVFTVGRP